MPLGSVDDADIECGRDQADKNEASSVMTNSIFDAQRIGQTYRIGTA